LQCSKRFPTSHHLTWHQHGHGHNIKAEILIASDSEPVAVGSDIEIDQERWMKLEPPEQQQQEEEVVFLHYTRSKKMFQTK
jgi:hypothetical protein